MYVAVFFFKVFQLRLIFPRKNFPALRAGFAQFSPKKIPALRAGFSQLSPKIFPAKNNAGQ